MKAFNCIKFFHEMTLQFKPVDLENSLSNLGTSGTGHTTLTLLKELIDNGIDAGATEIITKCSGKRDADGRPKHIIKYTDNGCGMDREQLYKSIQITSKNDGSGIGNYGIGGTSAIVNFAQINDPMSPSITKIIAKTPNGQVRSIQVDWKNDINADPDCTPLDNLSKRVTSSFTENHPSDVSEMSNVSHGTIISIYTSQVKCDEISKICTNWDNYQDMEITYKSQLASGLKLNIEDDVILSLEPCENLIEGNITIGIWKKPDCDSIYTAEWPHHFSLTATTPTGRYSTASKHKTKTDLKSANYTLHATMWLKVRFCKNNYKVKEFVSMDRSAKQFDYKNNSELYNTFNTILDISDDDTFQSLVKYRYEPLHICRKSRNNSNRGLSAVDLPLSAAGNWDAQLPMHISKTLIFSAENDDILGFTQQNKSCSGWNNAPKYLQKSIQTFVNDWVRCKVHPALDKMDRDADNKSRKDELLKNICRKKIKMATRCKFTYYPFDDKAVIYIQRHWRGYVVRYANSRTVAAKTIQKFMRDCKVITNMPAKGFIKVRNFLKWVFNYIIATKVEEIYIKYSKNVAIKKLQTTWRNYKIKSSHVKNLNIHTVIIQTHVRRNNALKKFHNMKHTEQQFLADLGKVQSIVEEGLNVIQPKRPYHKINEYVNHIQQLLVKYER